MRRFLFFMFLLSVGSGSLLLANRERGADRPALTRTTTTPEHLVQTPVLQRPYDAASPWNALIPASVAIHPDSATMVARIAAAGSFGSDPRQYTYPVHTVDATTPVRAVQVLGRFSNVREPGDAATLVAPLLDVPVPEAAVASAGTDGSVVLWDPATGDEWGFWRFTQRDGQWTAQNGYRYNTSWSAVPPAGFVSRGAGLPYLAGLVLRSEMDNRAVEHALAFAYNSPAPRFVYPATKSDGRGDESMDLPEGARLQLDPHVNDGELEAWGLDSEGKILARAMQRYGMIVVDNSGHPKVMVEDALTAGWGTRGAPVVTADTVASIPLDRFRVVDWRRWDGGPRA